MNSVGPSHPGKARWQETVVPFTASDGFACNLIHLQGPVPPLKGPVVLVHGAGVRANLFRAPVETTLADYLIERGYDVWLETWRASIDLNFSSWTLHQPPAYTDPLAVRALIQQTR